MYDFSSSSDEDNDNEIPRRRRKMYRPRINWEFGSQFEYKERFRMSSQKLEALLADLGPHLNHPTNKSGALSAKQQLCIALHWLGSGSAYHVISDAHGVSKAAVCRSIHSVVETVVNVKFPQIVDFPNNLQETAMGFFQIRGIPQIIGIVDGTLINIDAPTEHEEAFIDRHGNHSLNCMVVCGPNMMFYYVKSEWPGSVHDSRVLRNSNLFRRMSAGWRPIPGSIILADSAYPLLNWLIPPSHINVQDEPVLRFNRAHKATRRIVENSIGILKEKFPVLNYMRVNPRFASNIFKACTALCNISRQNEEMENEVYQVDAENEDNNNREENIDPRGVQRLQQLIALFN